MAQINIGGTSANVQLKGNNTITTDQAFTFPDTGGTIVTDDFTGDVEIDGSITAAGKIISKGDAESGANDGSVMNMDSGFSASYIGNSLIYRGYTTGNSTPTFSVAADGAVQSGGDAQGIKGTKLVYGTVYSTNDGGNAVWRGYATGSNQYKSEILGNGNATFVSTFAVNSFLKLDDGSNLDLKKVGLALVALKAAAATSTDHASLKTAIATALADL